MPFVVALDLITGDDEEMDHKYFGEQTPALDRYNHGAALAYLGKSVRRRAGGTAVVSAARLYEVSTDVPRQAVADVVSGDTKLLHDSEAVIDIDI